MDSASAKAPPAAGWLRGPAHDISMALIWVPFALAAQLAAHDAGQLRWLVSATLLFSFAHQPLSLWLVYGDEKQRNAHRALFAWAPLVTVVVVVVGAAAQPVLVALAAGIWNLAHTLRQRYGVSRLYGRRSGIDCSSDNRLLWAWLVAAVLVALARTDLAAVARQVGMDDRSTMAIDALASARVAAVVLLPFAGAVALVLTARSIQAERRRDHRSAARLIYLGSTAVLLGVLAVAPVTGFVAYVGAHAAEYFFVVRWRIDHAAEKPTGGDRVGALARRVGSGGTIGLYAAVVLPLTIWVQASRNADTGLIVVLTLGALHLLYDGFIWRRPSTPAASDPGRAKESLQVLLT